MTAHLDVSPLVATRSLMLALKSPHARIRAGARETIREAWHFATKKHPAKRPEDRAGFGAIGAFCARLKISRRTYVRLAELEPSLFT